MIDSFIYTFAKNVGAKTLEQRSKVMSGGVQLDKKTYIGIVKFTLQSMVELAAENKEYNITADTIHYYETVIIPEGIISTD